jgi:poly(A) polymerase Pap1
MPPINSPEDIFFYAITAVVLAVGFFLSWTLYYMALSFRDTRKVTKDIRQRVETFWEMIELARDKLQVGGAVFKVAATGIKELTDHLKMYTEKDDEPKKKKKKNKDDDEE